MKTQSLLIVVGVTIFGCGKPTPPANTKPAVPAVQISAQNQQSLFPFVEGNSWTFAIDLATEAPNKPRQSLTGEIQYKVDKVSKSADGSTRATISVTQNGKKQDEQEWSSESTGIYQISMKASKVAFNPKQPVIRFPVKDQEDFRWEGSGITPIGRPGVMRYAFKNDGIQANVDTDMGTMSALFMQTGGTFKSNDGIGGQVVVNSWFSPGVGLIRYRQVIGVKGVNSSITLRLKSYNVKK
jgi:hypothetical protein